MWAGFGNWRQPAFPFASHGHDGQKVSRLELTKRKSLRTGAFVMASSPYRVTPDGAEPEDGSPMLGLVPDLLTREALTAAAGTCALHQGHGG